MTETHDTSPLPAAEAFIAWTPSVYTGEATVGGVQVFPLPDVGNLSRRFVCSMPAGRPRHVRGVLSNPFGPPGSLATQAFLLLQFHELVTIYGIDPKVAHQALLRIDEYRALVS